MQSSAAPAKQQAGGTRTEKGQAQSIRVHKLRPEKRNVCASGDKRAGRRRVTFVYRIRVRESGSSSSFRGERPMPARYNSPSNKREVTPLTNRLSLVSTETNQRATMHLLIVNHKLLKDLLCHPPSLLVFVYRGQNINSPRAHTDTRTQTNTHAHKVFVTSPMIPLWPKIQGALLYKDFCF